MALRARNGVDKWWRGQARTKFPPTDSPQETVHYRIRFRLISLPYSLRKGWRTLPAAIYFSACSFCHVHACTGLVVSFAARAARRPSHRYQYRQAAIARAVCGALRVRAFRAIYVETWLSARKLGIRSRCCPKTNRFEFCLLVPCPSHFTSLCSSMATFPCRLVSLFSNMTSKCRLGTSLPISIPGRMCSGERNII